MTINKFHRVCTKKETNSIKHTSILGSIRVPHMSMNIAIVALFEKQ